MTDTGQVPGEGLPESAGVVEQPGVPEAHGAYGYLSESPAEDEDLLMPGTQGAWGNEVAPPAPEPIVEAVHQPGPHEVSGRDSGSVDLSGVRLPGPTTPTAPTAPTVPIPPITPRRPLHLGPPTPDASASPVRSLADRGAVGAPVRQPGPEYLDAPAAPQPTTPWPAPAPVPVAAEAQAAETVVPAEQPAGVAQAVVARVAHEAGATVGVAQEAEPVEAPTAQEGGYGGQEPSGGDADAGAGQDAVVTGGGAEAVDVAEAGPGDGVPVVEAAPVAGVPVVEVGQVAEGPVAEGAQAPEAPEAPVAESVTEPVAEPVAEAVAEPGSEVAGDGVGPVVEQVAAEAGQVADGSAPESEPLPEAVQVPDAPAPEAVQVPDAPAPEAVEVVEVVAPEPPEQFPEDLVTYAAAQATSEAVPVPSAADAEQAPQLAQAEPVVAAPQPTEVDSAPVAVAPEPAPLPVDAEQATPQQNEPLPPAEQPVQAPEAVPDPHFAQDAAAEAQPVAVSTPAPMEDPAAPVAEPEAQLPDTPPTQDVPAEPAAPAQPLAAAPAAEEAAEPTPAEAAPVEVAAETPVPFVAEPAGPQLRLAPADDAQAQTPLPAGESGEGEAVPPATGVPEGPAPAQPMGQFVPVEGSVPTTPHLAPTPPQPILLPVAEGPGPLPTVPAPREGDPELVQHAEDLDTRAAEQEDHQAEESTAVVEEARQSAGPAAPAYDDAEREAVLKVMRERRDIRNGFRSDPIPHEVLLRVLEAAHTAPSVGHSQPWDFVVIRSADTRQTMHELAMRQREAYAKSLPKGRAKQFKELKIEAILDTPVNIVVTADPTRGGRHTLGRHTQPQMAPYSAALAVENLWLAARAEGLGVGWVSFFDEREMVRALGLPEHLEVIAYLCVGYVDEFPDEPELMQAGWSKRRPLSWVVHEETYGRRALPGEEPHDLLAETVAQIRPLDAKALGEAWERQKRMTKPAGALGMLEIISAQLSGLSRQCPPPIPEPAAVAIFAGDHGVHAQGVTPWPQEVTAQMVANFLGGGAVCNAFAGQVGAEVCVVDVGVAADLPATPGLLPRKVRAGTSDMTTGPAMTREEAKQAIEVGIETARDLVAAGNKALLTGEMGIANTTASAALISVYTGAEPAEVTGRGTGINDETLARKTEVVRRAIELHQPDPADPIGVLAAIGGFEHAAIVGLLLGGASLRTPVILDGVSAGAAALVARAIAPEVLAACIAGHRSAEPGHVAALNKLGLRPLVDLDLRLGEGTGALLALPLVQSTARAMHEVATFDSAGVTEK
ncbi:nicotinate-nucleotide--dimethylbenzimidazole phosphoribosyltransferase [Streptomyces sp. NPDC093568]|uniref:nicotinate-nucleotide--dimethylbenzimidazole phosphoribosyltransferase n=1 Tax=Streptomyces sp. NPDC093568 TaxID=3366041 RepID=UPI0037FFD547